MSATSCHRVLILLLMCLLAAGRSAIAAPRYGSDDEAGRFVSVNGIRLYVEIRGSGEPLLLLHGNAGSIGMLGRQIGYFASRYQVIAPDMRGHGRSDDGSGALSYAQLAQDIAELAKALGIRRWRVFGWSDGGVVGLKLALARPELVERLAIMGANTEPPEESAYPWAIRSVKAARAGMKEQIEAGEASEELVREYRAMSLLFSDPGMPPAQLATIEVPVLVMAADRDLILPAHTQAIFESLPRAHLAILPGQTHNAPWDDAVRVNTLVEEFFSRPFARPLTEDML